MPEMNWQINSYVRFDKELEYLVRKKIVDNVKSLGLMIFSCQRHLEPQWFDLSFMDCVGLSLSV